MPDDRVAASHVSSSHPHASAAATDTPIEGVRLLSNLLYTDDIMLLAHCPAHLQQLLDALLTFCTATSLQNSMPNTKVMIFRRLGRQSTAGQHVFTLRSLPLTHTTYKYLRVNITSSGNPGDYMPPSRRDVHRIIICGPNITAQHAAFTFQRYRDLNSNVWQRAMGSTSADSCRTYTTVTATREVLMQAVQNCA